MVGEGKAINVLNALVSLGVDPESAARVQREITKEAGQIQARLDKLNSTKAQKSMELWASATREAGGVAKLTTEQTSRLVYEIERLQKAGAKVPIALQPAIDAMHKMRDAEKAAADQAAKTAEAQARSAADTAQLKSGMLDKAGLGALAGAGPVAGALLAVGAMAGVAKETFDLINSTAELADEVSNLSAKYQISTDAVQQFQFMADRSGVSLDTFGQAIVTITKNLDEAPEKFQRWGMDVEHLRSLKPEELLGAMAEKLKTLNESDRLTMSKDLMKTVELLPVLLDDFDQLVAKARELGMNLSSEDINALKGLRDDIDDVGTAWEGMWVQLGAALAQDQDVQNFFTELKNGIVSLTRLIKENKSEIVDFAKLMAEMATLPARIAADPRIALDPRRALEQAKRLGGLLAPGNTGGASGSWGDPEPKKLKKAPGQHGAKLDPGAKAAAERAAKAAFDHSVADTQLWSKFLKDLHNESTKDFVTKLNSDASGLTAAREGQAARAKKAAEAAARGASELQEDLALGPMNVAKRGLGGPLGLGTADLKLVIPQLYEAEKITFSWSQYLQDAAAQFQLMGRGGQAVGKVVGALGGLGSIFSKGGALEKVKGVGDLFKGGGLAVAKNMMGGLTAGLAAFDIGKTLYKMFHKTEAQKVAADVGRDYGVKISEGLAEEIAKNSKKMGRDGASLLSLDKIVGEAGGVQAFGVEKTASKMRDLFSMVQTGKMTLEQAKGPFDKLFGEVAQASISKTTGLISSQAAELRDLALSSGMKSDAVLKFQNQQRDVAQTIIQRIAKSDLGFANTGISEAIGTAMAAQYERYVAEGLSGSEIAEKMGPLISELQEKFHRSGTGGGAAFDSMLGKVELFRDELTGPTAQAFQDIIGLSAALFNSGDLTKTQFKGLAAAATGSFRETQERLSSQGKDPDAAFEMMSKDLQKLWEMQRRYNVELDDATKAMLAEAEKQGVVGEEFMDPLLREAELTNQILERGFTALGADLSDLRTARSPGGPSAPEVPSQPTLTPPTDMSAYENGGYNSGIQKAISELGEGFDPNALGGSVGDAINPALGAIGSGLGAIGSGLGALAAGTQTITSNVVLQDGTIVGTVTKAVDRNSPEGAAFLTALAEKLKGRG